jgi:hypothetical protein
VPFQDKISPIARNLWCHSSCAVELLYAPTDHAAVMARCDEVAVGPLDAQLLKDRAQSDRPFLIRGVPGAGKTTHEGRFVTATGPTGTVAFVFNRPAAECAHPLARLRAARSAPTRRPCA